MLLQLFVADKERKVINIGDEKDFHLESTIQQLQQNGKAVNNYSFNQDISFLSRKPEVLAPSHPLPFDRDLKNSTQFKSLHPIPLKSILLLFFCACS
jgi:hypothetical protein